MHGVKCTFTKMKNKFECTSLFDGWTGANMTITTSATYVSPQQPILCVRFITL